MAGMLFCRRQSDRDCLVAVCTRLRDLIARGHKLASPPRSYCHSPSHRSARQNRAAPIALERPIGLARPPTVGGTPCRNCLAGNTTLHVLVALFAPLFLGFCLLRSGTLLHKKQSPS